VYISEQLLNPSERRLRLSTQLGVEHVVLDNRGTELVSAPSGAVTAWDMTRLRDYRRWVEGFGLTLDVFALDVGSILLDSLVDLEGARKSRDVLARNIAVAAEAGITCLKYNVQMVGITRTALKPGRGGAMNSSFVHADYSADDDRKHSYWGVGYPGHDFADAAGAAVLCGQKLAREVPAVTEQAGWDAIEFLVNHGHDEHYGARPLKRAIQHQLENPLAQSILRGDFGPGDQVLVTVKDGQLAFERRAAADPQPAQRARTA